MRKIDIKLGYSCNNDCLHCVVQDYREVVLKKGLSEDVPSQDFIQEMEFARKRGFDTIVFTGGEPTIRPDLPFLLRKARELGFFIQMQTNGRRLANLEFARKITASAPIFFCIAIHSCYQEVHDRITQRAGSFEETVAGIKNLISLGQKVSAKIVISRLNYHHLKETCEFLLKLGISHISLTFPHGCGNARKFFFQVVPRYTEIADEVKKAIKVILARGKTVDTEAIPFCFLPEFPHLVTEIFLAEEE